MLRFLPSTSGSQNRKVQSHIQLKNSLKRPGFLSVKPHLSSFNKEYLNTEWDVVVIGGGPAGMMAAISASKRGKKVLIIEKNEKLGKKLLITGGGRCNVTNATFDNRELLKKYGTAEKFLFSPFSKFSTQDTIDFFNQKGVNTKVEAENRVFPVSNRAESIWSVLVDEIKALRIQVHSNVAVSELYIEEQNKKNEESIYDKKKIVKGVKVLSEGRFKKILAHSVIVATGGMSHPETGSTGDGFEWMRQTGHTVTTPIPSLVPLSIKDVWVKKLQGVTLIDIQLTIAYDDFSKEQKNAQKITTHVTNLKKIKSVKGKILFTHFGVTGPTVLNLSKEVSDKLKYNSVYLLIDARPDFDHGQINVFLQKKIDEHKNKLLKNMLGEIIPVAIVSQVMLQANIPSKITCNSLTREMRMDLIQSIKGLMMEVKGLLGDDKAIISSGGVQLKEMNLKTMESNIVQNLYVIGDMLDIDRPSGGYSLQLCWTTGYVSGENV